MKKKQPKIQNNAPLTKKDFAKVRVTLEGRMGNLEGGIQDLRSQIEQVEERIGKKMKDYHNEVMTGLDPIAGAVKKFDEEREVLAYRQTNHTDRIEKLETAVFGKSSE